MNGNLETLKGNTLIILENLKEGIPPMRISENLNMTRQGVYHQIKVLKEKGFITDEELAELKNGWSRKPLTDDEYKGYKEKVLEYITSTVPMTSNKLLIKSKKIPKTIYKTCMDELLKEGKINEECHLNYTKKTEYMNQKREEFSKILCEEFKEYSFRQLSIKHEKPIRTIVLTIEYGIAKGFLTQDLYDELRGKRRTYKKTLTDINKESLVEQIKQGVDIETIAKEFDRTPMTIKRYVEKEIEDYDFNKKQDREIQDIQVPF